MGTHICRLPPHVSLKQPFVIDDLPALEKYLQELADRLAPVDVVLTELQLIPIRSDDMETGLIWWDIQENAQLRGIHDLVNSELAQRFGNTQADHDGAEYHFHMTVMIGGQPIDVYRSCFGELSGRKGNLHFRAGELALFVYDEPIMIASDYMTYRILPLKGNGETP